jgi:hypothetical protein
MPPTINRHPQVAEVDFPRADLLIVLGTSLVVHPFASLIGGFGPHGARLPTIRALILPLAASPALCSLARRARPLRARLWLRLLLLLKVTRLRRLTLATRAHAGCVGGSVPRLLINRERVGEDEPYQILQGCGSNAPTRDALVNLHGSLPGSPLPVWPP